MNYPNLIQKRLDLTPERLAFQIGERSWTWKEAIERAKVLAQHLPCHSGERLGILSKNNEELYFVILAALAKQCEIVFFNERLSASELQYQIEDANPVCILTDHPSRIETASIPVYSFDELEILPIHPYQSEAQWDGNNTISIMYTSGTTGKPKGVRQTLENHMTSALGAAITTGVMPHDKWLCVMPLFHISGFSIVMRSLIYGSALELHSKFDAKQVASSIFNHEITHLSVVTTMLGQLLDVFEAEKQTIPQTFRTILAGGGPVPAPYLERSIALGLPVLQTYGMTETSSQTATLMAEDALRKLGSAGKPLFFADIVIDGEEQGEIWVSGPHVTPGYIGCFVATAATTTEGWLKTGDIGRFDDEGYLYILDRRSDLIVSGGENIYPAEVEQVLLAHPDVQEAGVVGVDHPKWGQVPIAFVVMEQEDRTSLEQFASVSLAKYKQPTAYYFVDKLPRNASNKLLRRKLKDLLK